MLITEQFIAVKGRRSWSSCEGLLSSNRSICCCRLLTVEVTRKPGPQLCGPLVSRAAKLWDVKSKGEAAFEGGGHRLVIYQTAAEDKRGSNRFPVSLRSQNTVHTTVKLLCICIDDFPRGVQRDHLLCPWGSFPGGVWGGLNVVLAVGWAGGARALQVDKSPQVYPLSLPGRKRGRGSAGWACKDPGPASAGL